jgi:DNA-binding GntR family transcriptional regulator
MTYDHEAMQRQAEDLRRDVLAILQARVGAGRAIRAREIAQRLGLRGRYADRPVREAIKQLRRDGHLILSSVGRNPGYYVAATEQEWREFRDANLRPRAYDILETARAMGTAAQRRWGSGVGEVVQLEMPELVA